MTDIPLDDDDDRWWDRSMPQVLSRLGVGLLVARPEKVVVVNDAFCALTGYSTDEILAVQPFVDMLAPDARDLILDEERRRMAGGDEPSQQETEILHRDGRRIPVEVGAHVAVIEGRNEIVATFRDLTENKRIQADLAARARQQETVAELGRQALTDRNLTSLMVAAVNGVARILAVEYVEVLELLPDHDAFLLRAGVGWEDGLVGHATVPAGLESPAGFTLVSDGPLVVEDMSRVSRFGVPPLLSDHGVVAGLTVVIRGGDQPYGVLGGHASHHRQFSRDDVHFLRAVANVLADTIARTAVEANLATRARQQAAIAELGRRALAGSDLSALLEAAVDAVVRTLDVQFVEVLELLPGGDAFRFRAGAGWEDDLAGDATVRSGLDSQAGFTLASDAPVVVEDLARDTRFTPAPLLLQHGVVSGISVIILGRNRSWGVLCAHATTRRRFRDDDVNFLQATANVMADAIGQMEVEGELRAAHHRERSLRRRLEAHSRMVVEAQEAERRRIARELHDEIGQTLTGLKLTLEDHQRRSAEGLADRLGPARALASELLQRIQDMSLDLRPAVLDDLGLHPALLWLVERYGALTGVAVTLRCSELGGRHRPEVETAAYRIVQEGLTNVARHAGVKRATVECAVAGNALRVEVADEGIGFDIDAIPLGRSSGLAGMEERARSAGGRLRLRSEPGRGTTVVAEFPRANSETE